MRMFDDRYAGEDLQMKLALRMIRLEARTHTIKQWTALSDDRIRKLYRRYVQTASPVLVPRHRGKSPRRPAFFFQSADHYCQAAQLASLFLLHELLVLTAKGVQPRFRVGSLPAGELLCFAYETYAEHHAPACISFEHGWFLLLALARRDELGLMPCAGCGATLLRDLLARREPHCTVCMPAMQGRGTAPRQRGMAARPPC